MKGRKRHGPDLGHGQDQACHAADAGSVRQLALTATNPGA
jgi:hypothetical protein